MNTARERSIVQHGIEAERSSIDESQKVTVKGVVLELPHDHIMCGFVRLDGGTDAVVWKRVLKESGQANRIFKDSKVECEVHYGNPDSPNKPRIRSIKLSA